MHCQQRAKSEELIKNKTCRNSRKTLPEKLSHRSFDAVKREKFCFVNNVQERRNRKIERESHEKHDEGGPLAIGKQEGKNQRQNGHGTELASVCERKLLNPPQ
jgi:recombination DNA repair RAD52 pathway protein